MRSAYQDLIAETIESDPPTIDVIYPAAQARKGMSSHEIERVCQAAEEAILEDYAGYLVSVKVGEISTVSVDTPDSGVCLDVWGLINECWNEWVYVTTTTDEEN